MLGRSPVASRSRSQGSRQPRLRWIDLMARAGSMHCAKRGNAWIPSAGYRGRRRTKVTLRRSSRIVEKWVSPHLQFTARFAEDSTRSLRRAKDNLEVLREFAVRQTRPAMRQGVS